MFGRRVSLVTTAVAVLAAISCAARAADVPPSIALSKTVGTDPASCSTNGTITVTIGMPVTYCYTVMNTSALTYTLHSLVDDKLGLILSQHDFQLAPMASAFLTQTVPMGMLGTVVNNATWVVTDTISEPPMSASGSDMATVMVLSDAENGTGLGPAGCSDGTDGDGDGLIDCGDPDCQGAPPCIATAPALGPGGFIVAALLLLAVGGVALTLQRRGASRAPHVDS